MTTAQSPIKVREATKERIRHAALLAGCNQAEFVDRAVAEYVEHHHVEFAQRMESAREALLGGKTSTLAYSAGVEEGDVMRVGGVASDQISGSRRPRRATSNQASSPPGQSARGSHSSAPAASKAKPKSTSRRRSSTKRPSAA
jgi:hypothetical protein